MKLGVSEGTTLPAVRLAWGGDVDTRTGMHSEGAQLKRIGHKGGDVCTNIAAARTRSD